MAANYIRKTPHVNANPSPRVRLSMRLDVFEPTSLETTVGAIGERLSNHPSSTHLSDGFGVEGIAVKHRQRNRIRVTADATKSLDGHRRRNIRKVYMKSLPSPAQPRSFNHSMPAMGGVAGSVTRAYSILISTGP